MFPTPVTARYIRIYSFYYYGDEEHIRCHKFELIGCLNDGKFEPVSSKSICTNWPLRTVKVDIGMHIYSACSMFLFSYKDEF